MQKNDKNSKLCTFILYTVLHCTCMFSTFSTSSSRSKKHSAITTIWFAGELRAVTPCPAAKFITAPRSYQQCPAARRFWFGGLAHPRGPSCWLGVITYNLQHGLHWVTQKIVRIYYDHLRLSLLRWYPQFFTSLGYKNPGVDIIPASSIAKLLLFVVAPKSRDFNRSWEKTPLQEKWTVTARNRARTGRVMSPFGRKLSPFGRAMSPLPNWSSYWQRNPSKPQKSRWCPKHGFRKKAEKRYH